MENFYKKYNWLQEFHPWAIQTMYVMVVKVNPKTKRIGKDESKNTEIRYWIETGPYMKERNHGAVASNDYDLCTGGATFEEMIVNLARLIKRKYGHETDMYGDPVK